jgi:hypothetical protein
MMHVDVKNVLKIVSQVAILKKLCDAGGLFMSIVPFTRLFYGAHSFLYY